MAGERKLIEAAIEESLRPDPPVRLLIRTRSAATVIAGARIGVGEAVVFGVERANQRRSQAVPVKRSESERSRRQRS